MIQSGWSVDSAGPIMLNVHLCISTIMRPTECTVGTAHSSGALSQNALNRDCALGRHLLQAWEHRISRFCLNELVHQHLTGHFCLSWSHRGRVELNYAQQTCRRAILAVALLTRHCRDGNDMWAQEILKLSLHLLLAHSF